LKLPTSRTPTSGADWWQHSPNFRTCPACGSPGIAPGAFTHNIRKLFRQLGRETSGQPLADLVDLGFRPGEQSLSTRVRELLDRGEVSR
jgi:hypothetical protein